MERGGKGGVGWGRKGGVGWGRKERAKEVEAHKEVTAQSCGWCMWHIPTQHHVSPRQLTHLPNRGVIFSQAHQKNMIGLKKVRDERSE